MPTCLRNARAKCAGCIPARSDASASGTGSIQRKPVSTVCSHAGAVAAGSAPSRNAAAIVRSSCGYVARTARRTCSSDTDSSSRSKLMQRPGATKKSACTSPAPCRIAVPGGQNRGKPSLSSVYAPSISTDTYARSCRCSRSMPPCAYATSETATQPHRTLLITLPRTEAMRDDTTRVPASVKSSAPLAQRSNEPALQRCARVDAARSIGQRGCSLLVAALEGCQARARHRIRVGCVDPARAGEQRLRRGGILAFELEHAGFEKVLRVQRREGDRALVVASGFVAVSESRREAAQPPPAVGERVRARAGRGEPCGDTALELVRLAHAACVRERVDDGRERFVVARIEVRPDRVAATSLRRGHARLQVAAHDAGRQTCGAVGGRAHVTAAERVFGEHRFD